jgi:predicted porin
MKRTILISSLLAMTGSAWAQSNVTIYGIADAGLSYVTGLRGGSSKQLVSGIMEGSRLGFRGNEDLGGGYRAVFTLENRLELDNGSISNRPPSGTQLPDRVSNATLMGLPSILQPAVSAVGANIATQSFGVNLNGAFWDRQAFVGLVTPVGAVLAGRQYTPAYEISATYDIMKTESSLSAGQVASFPPSVDIRVSNALSYRVQAQGFSASLMYAFGETAGSNSANRLAGGMLMYKNDVFSVGAGYNTRNNELGDKSLSTLTVGGSVNAGPGTVSMLYGSTKDDHPTGLSGISALLTPTVGAGNAALVQNAFIEAIKQDGRLYHIGYRLGFGASTVSVAYSRYDDKRPNNADVSSYGAVYSYAFSKRTDVNLVLTHFDNKNLAQAAPGQAGFLGGVTESAGKDSNNVALGIRHRF